MSAVAEPTSRHIVVMFEPTSPSSHHVDQLANTLFVAQLRVKKRPPFSIGLGQCNTDERNHKTRARTGTRTNTTAHTTRRPPPKRCNMARSKTTQRERHKTNWQTKGEGGGEEDRGPERRSERQNRLRRKCDAKTAKTTNKCRGIGNMHFRESNNQNN